MNKVLVLIEDQLLSSRVARVLHEKGIPHEIVKTPVRKEELLRYSCVVVHSSYRIQGLFAFLEHLIVSGTIPILYVSMNTVSNQFSRFRDHPFFVHLDELRLDAELPIAIQVFDKQSKSIDHLRQENKQLQNQLELERALSKAKRHLMSQGMTEEMAHQAILKLAMDEQMSKLDACMKILHSKSN